MSGHFIEPLLYIDQPTIEKPKAFMQDYYYTPTKNEVELENETSEKVNAENGTSSFKNLNVEEKIDYLLNLPDGVPKIRCEFTTDEKVYRGILLSKQENEVSISVVGQENVTISINKLKDIQMIGF